MQATEVTTQMTFRCSPLPELEVPMINTMVTCLGSEHRRLNYTTVQLAFAATRLASDPGAVTANQRSVIILYASHGSAGGCNGGAALR